MTLEPDPEASSNKLTDLFTPVDPRDLDMNSHRDSGPRVVPTQRLEPIHHGPNPQASSSQSHAACVNAPVHISSDSPPPII